MNGASRPTSTGKTRTCPHCKATILESLSICPGCLHHLRFDQEAAKRQVAAAPALRVEGIIRHPPLDAPLEYFVVIGIRNDRGEEVTRQVVNVGALQSGEKRTFSMSVEVLPVQAAAQSKTPVPTGAPSATIRPPAMVSPDSTAAGSSGTHKVLPPTVQSSARIRPPSDAQPPAPKTIARSPANSPFSTGAASGPARGGVDFKLPADEKSAAKTAPAAGGSAAGGSAAGGPAAAGAARNASTPAAAGPGASTSGTPSAAGPSPTGPAAGGPKRH